MKIQYSSLWIEMIRGKKCMVRTYRKAKISTMNVMKRMFSIINIIPANIILRLYLDDIMYPISYHAQRLGSDQVRNTTNE